MNFQKLTLYIIELCLCIVMLKATLAHLGYIENTYKYADVVFFAVIGLCVSTYCLVEMMYNKGNE